MSKLCTMFPSVSQSISAFENAEPLTFPDMQTPTVAQIETAIDVLNKLAERLNIQAAHFIVQLPETQIGTHYAGTIGLETGEQNLNIKNLTKKLKIWEEELTEETKGDPAKPSMRSRFNDVLEQCIVLEEKYFAMSRAS